MFIKLYFFIDKLELKQCIVLKLSQKIKNKNMYEPNMAIYRVWFSTVTYHNNSLNVS